jgi:hypothetical protein
MHALVDGMVSINMEVTPKPMIRSNLVELIAWGVPLSGDGLLVLFHVVH